MASEMSDDLSELGMEQDGVPMSSASSISNDLGSEVPNDNVMSETEDSNSYLEPSSSETDSYLGSSSKQKDDGSSKSSSSDATLNSSTKEAADDGAAAGSKSKLPIRPGIQWRKGERLEAEDYQRHWYPSKIMSIDEEKLSVLIHFEGWNQRYDEWVEMNSERLRPLTRHSERKGRGRKWKTVYKVGDQVLAKWTDCKMYLAKVDEVMDDGSYMVLFYDGFRKNIRPINLLPAPLDCKQQKFQIKPPVLSPKELKNIKSKPVDFRVTDETHASVSGRKAKKLTGHGLRETSSKTSIPATSTHHNPTPSTSTSSATTATSSATASTASTASQPAAEKLPKSAGHVPSSQKKSKLMIVSGSLFSKKDKSEKTSPKASPKALGSGLQKKFKEKEVTKVKVKQEVKVKEEAPQEVADDAQPEQEAVAAAVATEASSQTTTQTTTPPVVPRKTAMKRRQRSGSFPGEKRKRARIAKGPKAAPAEGFVGTVKKAKSADTDKPLESPVLPVAPLLPPTLPVLPPKAFHVEEDHNTFKCETCGKGFRKNQLLHDHIKHYHKAEGLNLTPAPTRKRKKTLSTCSTDSDMSVSSKSNSAKRRRHISEVSVGSPDIAMKMSFEEEGPGTTGSAVLEVAAPDPPAAEPEEEMTDEVVNCVCGSREDTGTMIQCDCCQCWQHTLCLGYTDQDLNSDTFLNTYICLVCRQPRGVRESARYLYDMDWFRKGKLPTFSFVTQSMGIEGREKEALVTHNLVKDLLTMQKVMHGLREEIAVTSEKDHPELRLWHPQPVKETRSIAISTADHSTAPDSSHPQTGPASTQSQNITGLTTPSGDTASHPTQAGQPPSSAHLDSVEVKPDISKPSSETNGTVSGGSGPALGGSGDVKVESDADSSQQGPADLKSGSGDRSTNSVVSADGSIKTEGVQSDAENRTSECEKSQSEAEKNPSETAKCHSNKAGPDQSKTDKNENSQCDTGKEEGGGEKGQNDDTKNKDKNQGEAAEKLRETGAENLQESDKVQGEAKDPTAGGDDGNKAGSRQMQQGEGKETEEGGTTADSKQGDSAEISGMPPGPVEKTEVKVEPSDVVEEQAGDGSAVRASGDPLADCKLSLLGYVRGVQDDLSHQLDLLEQHISVLERQDVGVEATGSYNTMPALKHALYRLARDLNKVKSIAAYR